MTQGEIRQNKVTNEWVIFSPSRGKRPHDFKQSRERDKILPEIDENCPFCPGNERHLDSVIMELPLPGNTHWQTRTVPNKFPALGKTHQTERSYDGIYLKMPGYGKHEVIIESPLHNTQIASMSIPEVRTVVETYHQRYSLLLDEFRNMMIVIFKNHGPRAGTSLIHPHSQIVVTPMVPHHVRNRERESQRHFDTWGKCVICELLEFETKDDRRVVLQNENFVAFIPYAAAVPFEIWIVPKHHKSCFGAVNTREKDNLAAALSELLGRLYHGLNDPDYNYVILTSAQSEASRPQLHWFLQIRPRLTTQAGFEIGSGMSINPSLPEDDARFIREVVT